MSAAISLRMHGVDVDLIDIDPQWRALGAGMTITGPTLRAFDSLGVLDAVREKGYISDRTKFFSADGTLQGEMLPPPIDKDLPVAGGILRPDLHGILSKKVMELGTNVRLGITITDLSQDASGVTATFSTGETGRYDAVIGADGFNSVVRGFVRPDAPRPRFTGQGCWRLLAPRPEAVTSPEIYFGSDYKVGVNPCSPDQMYLFANVKMPGNPHIPDDELLPRMRELLAPLAGTIRTVHDGLSEDSAINYRPLEALLVPLPWHAGRIGLIGDAVHATTPHLASGAGLSVEDGLLIGEMLADAEDVESALAAFGERRWQRSKVVVENSVKIGDLEQAGGNDARVAQIMGESIVILARPI
ncbi:FAD-dependent monooxygenase [Novosphingobium olei]|nr:FAD-dependent monooxygenase [Novosphingobium olei]